MDSIDIGGYFVTDDIEDPESFYQIPIGNDSTIIEPEFKSFKRKNLYEYFVKFNKTKSKSCRWFMSY